MPRFTPGPWRSDRYGYVWAPDEQGVVQIAKVGDFHDRELLPFSKVRWTADARLIAAAPELYAALKILVDGTNVGMTDFDAAVESARAALARAGGRSPSTINREG